MCRLVIARQKNAGIAGPTSSFSNVAIAVVPSGTVIIPYTLRHVIEQFRHSELLKETMGEEVVALYIRCAESEQQCFDNTVTQWEITHGFERA